MDRTYYLLSGRQLLSWSEAEELCNSLGGHLPSLTTPKDTLLLERLLLGPLQHDGYQEFVPETDCRYSGPLCMMFIGLKTNQVTVQSRLDWTLWGKLKLAPNPV